MPTLREVQQAVRRGLFGNAGPGSAADPASFAAPDLGVSVPGLGASALERLSIYRNTCRGTLLNALRLSFPAVQRLVGEEFFEGAVQCFIDEAAGGIPNSAWLYEYGGELAAFLAAFPAAAGLPYLGEVAQLEWVVNRALHAPDAARFDLAQLASLIGGRADAQLIPHASIGLLSLRYPADTIWRAVLEEDDTALAAVNLSAGPVRLLIERDDTGVQVQRLHEAAWTLAKRLCAGLPLCEALDSLPLGAESRDVTAALLAEQLSARRFIGVRLPDDTPPGDPES